MKYQIKEFAQLTGVSVRTLHYYDEIGLLEPSYVDEQNGYRFYNEQALERMQEILLFRELDFPLKKIIEILSSPNYDKRTALDRQKNLLILKQERLRQLINAIDKAAKGEETMNFKAFKNNEYEIAREKYAQEVKSKWGNTDAFKEYEEKSSNYTKEKQEKIIIGLDGLIADFANCMKSGTKPTHQAAQDLVDRWKDFITKNYYTCTKEILSGLGVMYIADERFKENIDKHGDGTAEFMSKAIDMYCNH